MDKRLTALVEQAAASAVEKLDGVQLLYVVGKEDGDHTLGVKRNSTWRVVLDGWAPSHHRCAVHTIVNPRVDAGDDIFRKDVVEQMGKLLRSQKTRAKEASKRYGISQPLHRELFENEAGAKRLNVDHLVVNHLSVMRLIAEENGDLDAVRNRISVIANREILKRERGERRQEPGYSLRRNMLEFPIEMGTATLDGNILYLRDRLPEIMIAAAGGWKGVPLSRLVQASGIDNQMVKHVADGRIYDQDARPYARECGTAVVIAGKATATLGRILESVRIWQRPQREGDAAWPRHMKGPVCNEGGGRPALSGGAMVTTDDGTGSEPS